MNERISTIESPPEVARSSGGSPVTVRQLERLAAILDNRFRIPGTSLRFGLDAIVGILPVVGDLAGSGMSLYILYNSYLKGVRSSTLLRMIWNIACDTILGAVPVLGDFFDFTWQANQKNVNLALEDLRSGAGPRRTQDQFNRVVLTVFLGIIFLLLALGATVTVFIVRQLL